MMRMRGQKAASLPEGLSLAILDIDSREFGSAAGF
jgi:hypothetical protein